ncbi:MAG: hypothetical protein ABEJ36_00975 [Candidatus Nanosalina sp.]
MAEQVVKTPEQIQEEVLSEETDTRIETKSAVWNQRINLELTERTMRKTEKKVVENGNETRKIEIDEDMARSLVSYPSPGKIYSQEAEKVTAEIKAQEEPEEDEENVSRQRPQLVFVKLQVPKREPREKQVVEVKTPEEDLKPTTRAVETEDTAPETFEVGEVESFSFESEREVSREAETGTEAQVYRQEASDYQGPETESFSPPESPVENPFTPDIEVEEDYSLGAELEPEDSEEDYRRFSPLLEDFEDLEASQNSGDAVFTAEYSEHSEVSERLVMDLEAMFPYQDSVSGSEAVETLWSEYGVEATVAEVPYFSENSGESWEEGWNSFDMVLQMNGMSMLETEYLSGDLYELGDLDQPAQRSIGAEFDTSEAIEFRESEEFSSHTSGYEASEKTKEAWAEKYGEEILELDGVERGVYAAFQEDRNFRGAELSPGETELLSDSAVEML